MLNPQADSQSPLSSRTALPVALILAGIFGLGAAVVESPKEAVGGAERPSGVWSEPAAIQPDNDDFHVEALSAGAEEDLVSFCSRNVTAKRSFVVFKHGTCVIINEPCKNPKSKALAILARCRQPDARFLTEPTMEGDMIVTFMEPVFHRFSPREMTKIRPWLEKSAAALLTPAESVAAGDGWVLPPRARYGLLARRRMLEDATDAVPVKIIRAKQRDLVLR